MTTVGHKREKVGEVSAKILKDVWAGKDVPVHNFTDVYYFSQKAVAVLREMMLITEIIHAVESFRQYKKK